MAFMALSPSIEDAPRFRERSDVSYIALGSSGVDGGKSERVFKGWCCSTSNPGTAGTVTEEGQTQMLSVVAQVRKGVLTRCVS